MNNRMIKRLMTDVAKGKLTMKEAEKLMKPKTLKLNKKEVKRSHNNL